ncbi:hypothetical protein FRB97_000783 [Tulasnella sp. 331]|nr:hypothetical protein FRB97_000783 [Tulasnella sp. 331]
MSRDLSNMSPDEMLVLSGHFKSSTDAAAARIQEILTTIREKSLKDEDGIKLYHISRFKRSIMLLAE